MAISVSRDLGYDNDSGLVAVGDGTNTAVYSYLANSRLVGNIGFQHNGQAVMTTTKTYDYLNRLTAIHQRDAGPNYGNMGASFNYNYNLANQRTAATNVDNSYWVYQYDSLGQVVSGKKYWANGTPVAGQQFTYNFDDIGNRQSAASGGDGTGSNLRTANYAANNLNEYTSRGIPSYSEISGSANANATVTVNLQRATRQGGYFWDELAVSNTTSPLWLALTNLAVLNNGTNADIIGTNQGNVFVKQTPEFFNFDADGNLTNDGRWAYIWDSENRLVKMTANTSVGPQYQLNFTYDAQSRRIQKVVATNGVAISTNNFIYDGWNLAAELNPNATLVRSYIWGSDLSGSAQGAGGVGGLIAVSYHGYATTNCFASFDGNGNIAALINAADGTVSANYEYAPFGEVIRSTGPLARNNPIRFSTKYQDDESDLLYYGYRYYNASSGRWPNREPFGEAASVNLMGFVNNNGVNSFDVLGLYNSAGHFYTTYAVAMAAGMSDAHAFQFAYWSQYPDQNQAFSATHNFFNGQWQVGEYLHSLTGGDPNKLRKYLECLLKSGKFSIEEQGMLIRALGDAYAHTFVDTTKWQGSPKMGRPNPNYGKLVLFGPGLGHFWAGHNPDYIGNDPEKYGEYVDQLYETLKSLNPGGIYDPQGLDALKDAAYNLPQSDQLPDFGSTESQNGYETSVLSMLGGYDSSAYNSYDPDALNKIDKTIPGMEMDVNSRDKFINKLKDGVDGCCPDK